MPSKPSGAAPVKVKCKAHNRFGKPCGLPPIRGGSVCHKHGGAAKQVRQRAAERIRDAADPAAAKLVQLMQDRKVSYAVQLAAARDLLDRAGISAKQPITLEIKPWEAGLHNVLVEMGDVVQGVVKDVDVEIEEEAQLALPPAEEDVARLDFSDKLPGDLRRSRRQR